MMVNILRRSQVHPAVAVFAAALAVRLLGACVVYVRLGGAMFLDDAAYHEMLSRAADLGIRAALESHLYAATAGFSVPLTLLYQMFGANPLVAQVAMATAGAGVAALTTLLALRVLTPGWASVAGLTVALLPSQILWSSLVLRDALVWLLLVGLAGLAAAANETRGRRLLLIGVAGAGLLGLLGYVRVHTLLIASIALVLAVALGAGPGRRTRVMGALAITVLVPWVIGLGPAGAAALAGIGSLEDVRCAYAFGGETSFVEDCAEVVIDGRRTAISLHHRPVGVAHLPKGLSVMLLEPYPGQRGLPAGLQLAAWEVGFLWYPLVGLAAVGLVAGGWAHRRVLAFPALVAGGIVVSYALAHGNLGTAFRHRGEIVWAIALLAAVGGAWTTERARLSREFRNQEMSR